MITRTQGRATYLVYVDGWRDSVTSKGQANPKESRERHIELWESAQGTRRAEGYQRMAAK